MKVISRFVAKMPTYKNSTSIRYELELFIQEKLYYVTLNQYVSSKLYKTTLVACTKDKQYAINAYNQKLNVLIGFL